MKGYISVLLCAFLVSITAAALFTVSHLAGFTFLHHAQNNLLLVKNHHSCYFVKTTVDLEKKLNDRVHRLQLETEIVHQIHNHQGLSHTSLVMAEIHHRDVLTSDCIGLDLYDLKVAA